jgi:hypothetical protein
LVGNTYAFFSTQKSELETMASRALLVDQALAQYGLEAKPVRDKLKVALTQSYDRPMEQTRLLMSLQLASPVAWPLIISVIAWSMFLFCGFGVLSATNPTTVAVLALGAISVASAMFLEQTIQAIAK